MHDPNTANSIQILAYSNSPTPTLGKRLKFRRNIMIYLVTIHDGQEYMKKIGSHSCKTILGCQTRIAHWELFSTSHKFQSIPWIVTLPVNQCFMFRILSEANILSTS